MCLFFLSKDVVKNFHLCEPSSLSWSLVLPLLGTVCTVDAATETTYMPRISSQSGIIAI